MEKNLKMEKYFLKMEDSLKKMEKNLKIEKYFLKMEDNFEKIQKYILMQFFFLKEKKNNEKERFFSKNQKILIMSTVILAMSRIASGIFCNLL